ADRPPVRRGPLAQRVQRHAGDEPTERRRGRRLDGESLLAFHVSENALCVLCRCFVHCWRSCSKLSLMSVGGPGPPAALPSSIAANTGRRPAAEHIAGRRRRQPSVPDAEANEGRTAICDTDPSNSDIAACTSCGGAGAAA